ncbi:hypothetical protein [Lapidilactobacillus bayanensis]|uniref:hypothetical protein n=1 Tax=Lapidilactobacillus bayanensis TaxID=2485998 RepID=UPI000F77374D|nr:hypothetical protein [Lapidilactobacillus bayanensis]
MWGSNGVVTFVAGLLILLVIAAMIGIATFIIQRNAWRRFALSRLADPTFQREHPLLQLADRQRLIDDIKLDTTVRNHSDLTVLQVAWLPYLRLSLAAMLVDNQIKTTYPSEHYDIALRDVTDEQLLLANSFATLLALLDPVLARIEPMIAGYEAAFQRYAVEQKPTPAQLQRILPLFTENVDYHEVVTQVQMNNTFFALATFLFKDAQNQTTPPATTQAVLPQWLTTYLQEQQ